MSTLLPARPHPSSDPVQLRRFHRKCERMARPCGARTSTFDGLIGASCHISRRASRSTARKPRPAARPCREVQIDRCGRHPDALRHQPPRWTPIWRDRSRAAVRWRVEDLLAQLLALNRAARGDGASADHHATGVRHRTRSRLPASELSSSPDPLMPMRSCRRPTAWAPPVQPAGTCMNAAPAACGPGSRRQHRERQAEADVA